MKFTVQRLSQKLVSYMSTQQRPPLNTCKGREIGLGFLDLGSGAQGLELSVGY